MLATKLTWSSELTQAAMRRAFGCFPSGVTAVCAMVDGKPTGMAASSFTSVSLDPALVSVCMAHTSSTWPVLRALPCLGVSVLSQEQDALCRTLSAKGIDRFAGVSWKTAGPDGAIVLDGSVAAFECTVRDEIAAGDHHIIVLQVQRLAFDATVAPLVFHNSTFRQLVPYPAAAAG